MARISAVVPAYNVEAYLEECLRSLAGQTASDLQVVVVDDGSTDGEPRDRRALRRSATAASSSSARPTPASAPPATPASRPPRGEYLAFVDGDDRLPPRAYELLLAHARSHGLGLRDRRRAPLRRHPQLARAVPGQDVLALARAHARDPLPLADLRPGGVEQAVAAQLLGRARPALPRGRAARGHPGRRAGALPRPRGRRRPPARLPLSRARADGAQSITQRRTDPETLRARVAAVEQVERFLDEQGPPGARRWYDESVASDDLRYHLDALDVGGRRVPRAVPRPRATRSSTRAGPGVEDPLPAIQRLKWHLVRRRALPELLEVLRFQQDEFRSQPEGVDTRARVRRLPVPRRPRGSTSRARSTGWTPAAGGCATWRRSPRLISGRGPAASPGPHPCCASAAAPA